MNFARVRRWIEGLLFAVAFWHVAAVVYAFARRVSYPLDLEWMEGGTLHHALRLMEGTGIYVPPSLDFIPFLYTPLYPALLAAVGHLTGLSYALGRTVSFLCFCGALLIAFRVIRREGGSLGLASAAVALVCASFPLVDGFYDLVRVDSLFLLLVVAGLYFLRYEHDSGRGVLRSALCLALAFWAKQTAAPLIAAGGLALLFLNWRKLWIYAGVVLLLDVGGSWALNELTEGWFWKVVFEMHQQHDLYWSRVLWKTQWTLFKDMPLAMAFPILWLPLAWLGRQAPAAWRGPIFWLWIALVGIQTSALSFATQWAARNAYIPGFFFTALFAGVGLADLARRHETRTLSLLSPLLSIALIAQLAVTAYRPTRLTLEPRYYEAAQRFLGRLRKLSQKGDLLIPYHPFYPVLVGRRPHFHQMGINDLTAARMSVPSDIRETLRRQRFAAVVLDKEPDRRYASALGLSNRRAIPKHETPAATLHGFRTRPRWIFEPGGDTRRIPASRRAALKPPARPPTQSHPPLSTKIRGSKVSPETAPATQ